MFKNEVGGRLKKLQVEKERKGWLIASFFDCLFVLHLKATPHSTLGRGVFVVKHFAIPLLHWMTVTMGKVRNISSKTAMLCTSIWFVIMESGSSSCPKCMLSKTPGASSCTPNGSKLALANPINRPKEWSVAVFTILKPFAELLTSIQAVWKSLIKHINRETAQFVFVALTVLLIYLIVLLSLLVAFFILRNI